MILGAGGREGYYFSAQLSTSGGDTSLSWTISGSSNSLLSYGGYEGLASSSQGGGGVYTISNVVNTVGTTGGGNGGSGVSQRIKLPGWRYIYYNKYTYFMECSICFWRKIN